VEGTLLETYAPDGRRLWARDLGPRLDAAEYRKPAKENVLIRDIDADGEPNVLVAVQNRDHFDEKVLCLDHRGKPLWEYKVGRMLEFGSKVISPDYDIILLKAEDLDADGRLETAVVANHKIYFPGRFLLLDSSGELMGEYWSTGHITALEATDLDGDGVKEILLGGVNNSYRRAFIAVLDPQEAKGASPHEPGSRYACPELGAGSEKGYLLLPPDPVGRALSIQDAIKSIDLLNDRRFELTTSVSRIHVEFDYGLDCTDVYLGDEFIERFNRLKEEGRLDIDLDDIDTEKLKADVLYWTGEGWVKRVGAE